MVEASNGWRKVTVGQLGKIVTGKTPPTKTPELFGTEYPFITPTDINQESRAVYTERFLSEEGFQKQRNTLLPTGAVCLTCIGATIGKICMTTRPSFTNQQINSVIVDEDSHDNRYVYYLLRHQADRVKSLAGGAATPIVNKSTFSSVELSVPSLSIQRKIASVLSAYDDLIENNTRRMEILEEMAQALYREWFVNFRFPGHEKVKMVESELGPVPKGWNISRVKDILKRLKAGKMYKEADVAEDGQVPVIDQSRNDFLGFHNNAPDHIASPQQPIVAFGDHTCKMQLMVEPFSIGPNVVPFVSPTETPILFLYFLVANLVETREYKRHWTELTNKKVVFPPVKLAERFSSLTTPIFECRHVLTNKNLILRRTRDLLLPKLLSGEVDVAELEFDLETLGVN